MNRGKITGLSVVIALLMVSALFLSFFLSGWTQRDQDGIVLPSKANPTGAPNGNVPDPGISFAPTIPLELGLSHARETIATLSRSDRYQCDLLVRWFWPEGQSSWEYVLSVRGDLFSIERKAVSGQPKLRVLGNLERLLWWTGDSSVVHDGQAGNFTRDDLCAVPTYESLLTLSDGAITDIGYQETERGRFLAVRAYDGVYYGEYLLSVDTGLLHQAVFYDTPNTEQPAYRMDMTRYQEGDPGDAVFTPPNEATLGS